MRRATDLTESEPELAAPAVAPPHLALHVGGNVLRLRGRAMRRHDMTAMKLLGTFVLGGTAMAAGLFLMSLLIPMTPSGLRIAMAVTVAAFTVMGLAVSVRYKLWSSKRSQDRPADPRR